MVKRKRSGKTCCRKKQKGGSVPGYWRTTPFWQRGGTQKGGFFGLIRRGFNAAGGIKGRDGKKRKFNLKHNYRNRKKEPLFQ